MHAYKIDTQVYYSKSERNVQCFFFLFKCVHMTQSRLSSFLFNERNKCKKVRKRKKKEKEEGKKKKEKRKTKVIKKESTEKRSKYVK